MARTVQEIMNRELLAIAPEQPAHEARDILREFRVAAAPVLDEARRPIGIVSLWNSLELGGTARERMRRPALCITASASVEQAARRLAEADAHHLVVVDGAGVAVGFVSTVDALRALLDIPARHPSTFPHWDGATNATWTDDWPLDEEGARRAPSGGGVLALTTSHLGERDAILWAESCEDVRARLASLVTNRSEVEPELARVLAHRNLRFRAAAVADDGARARIVDILRDRIAHVPPPHAPERRCPR
jgi:CBS domain-containing protein